MQHLVASLLTLLNFHNKFQVSLTSISFSCLAFRKFTAVVGKCITPLLFTACVVGITLRSVVFWFPGFVFQQFIASHQQRHQHNLRIIVAKQRLPRVSLS